MIDAVLTAKVVYDVTLVGAVGLALALGGWSERLGATIAVVATGATALVWPLADHLGFPARYGYLFVDTLTLIAFDALMVRSRAFWPLWATGLQLLTITISVAMIISPVPAGPYRLIKGKLAYPILGAMMLGSLRARRLKARAQS